MLTRNICLDKGFCNGSVGIVKDIIYKVGQCPPALPLAVVIEFKYYSGANFFRYYKKSVLILTLTSQTYVDDQDIGKIKLPLKLCWTIAIHKSQGLTTPHARIYLCIQEKSTGLSYVTISRVKSLKNLIFEPILFERLTIVRLRSKFPVKMA